MIHPATKLVHLNDEVGYGVVATDLIPAGTITYVKDDMEIVLGAEHPLHSNPDYRPVIEKFSYTESNGTKVLSWDHAKYVNHSCNFNTLSTGYGFEIAVRDIQKGEELTDDYGLFNIETEMYCLCGAENCRSRIGRNEFVQNSGYWDTQVKQALEKFREVEQPLLVYLEDRTRIKLENYLNTSKQYESVAGLELRYARELAV